MRRVYVLFSLLVALLLSGCGALLNKGNPYYKYSTIVDEKKYDKVRNKDRSIYEYKGNEEDVEYFLKRGYIVKAKAAFRYNLFIHNDWLELAAKRFGSEVVLASREYAGSRARVRPLTFRVPGEKYHIASETTVGNRTYTTYSTVKMPDKYETSFITTKDNYYDYYAIFLVKKYFTVNDLVTIYKTRDLEMKVDSISPGEWFFIKKEKNNYIKVGYKESTGYIYPDSRYY